MFSRVRTEYRVLFVGCLVIAAVNMLTAACAPAVPTTLSPAPVDLTQVTPCPAENGPGMTGPAPCVWDHGTERGNHVYNARWLYYSADGCPVATVQDSAQVHCIGRADWTGGVEDGRTN